MTLVSDIWSILTRRQKRHVLAVQLLSVLMAFSTVTGIAAIAPFFAVLGEPQLIDRSAFLHTVFVAGGFSSKRGFLVALGIAFIAAALIANLVNVLGALAMNRLALRIGNELQTTLFGEYLLRPYAFHTQTNSTTLFNNVVHETARVTNGILQSALQMFTNIITVLFIVLSMALLNPLLAITTLTGLAGGYALSYCLVRNRLLRCGEQQSHFSVQQARIVHESFGAIKEITILQVQDYFRVLFERASKGVSLAAAHYQTVAQSHKHIIEAVAVVGLVSLALALSEHDAQAGPLLGQLTFLAFALYRLLPALQQIFAAMVRMRAESAALATIAQDLRQARGAFDPAANVPSAAARLDWHERPRREIRLSAVSFRYSADRPWALTGVSLRIPARATIGIVGANGSGKTTVVELIAGLLVPQAGAVEVDGITLSERNRSSWQALIAYVPQNIFLLDASLAANIALGTPPEAIDRRRLAEAAHCAQLDDLIRTLPDGFDQRIGERGVLVSGGQRQRIGIARALYRSATLLLLDEATNALDGLTEQELIATLGRLRGRYTTILVAHRMSTVRSCDVIIELVGGKIAAAGSYEELLTNSAAFRRMAGVR